ncbi:MAG: MerR family transcriptional regulator [Evtepia gabavorous]
MKRSRYTVGEMANLCNVTAKQLRYYDQQGLLKPAYRDRQNGYRYYEDSQIEEVLLLSSLKELDLPNQRIGALLKKRDLRTLSRELEEQPVRGATPRRGTRHGMAKHDALIDNILRDYGGLSFLESTPGCRAEPSGGSVVEFPAAWAAHLTLLPVLLEGQPALHLPPGGAAEADGSGGAGTCGCEYGDLSLRLQEAVQ